MKMRKPIPKPRAKKKPVLPASSPSSVSFTVLSGTPALSRASTSGATSERASRSASTASSTRRSSRSSSDMLAPSAV